MAFIPDDAVMCSQEISQSAFRLFSYYCMRGGRSNPTCTASLERAARDLHMDYSYASRKRSELIKAGWVCLVDDKVYILKGLDEYTEEAQAIVAKKANSELLNQQPGFAKTATENCEKSKSHNKDEPAPLTSPLEPEQNTSVVSAHADPTISDGGLRSVSRTAQAVEIFKYWTQERQRNSRTVFDGKRKRAVEARLRDGHEVEVIKQAIRGIGKSPYHMGDNDRRMVYDDLELICRDSKHIENFAALDERKGSEGYGADARFETSSGTDHAQAGNRAASRRDRNLAELRRQAEEVRFDYTPSAFEREIDESPGYPA